MVKMPLLLVADALEGIPPLPRGNGLKGLFIKRVIIKISVKIDCVSLLSHTHTHTHATGEFSPCEKHPRKQECSESQLSPNSVVCHFFSLQTQNKGSTVLAKRTKCWELHWDPTPRRL